MHKKVQTSLLAVNVMALTMFVVGVTVIVSTEEPIATPETRPTVRGEDAEDVVRALPVPVAEPARVCEQSKKGCSQQSVLAPILFAFLAGGIMNLPELTSLPCI